MVRDVGLAEDLAQDALVLALERWPQSGVPENPGAWLMATAKHRAIDLQRRRVRLQRKHEQLARDLRGDDEAAARELEQAIEDDAPVQDDLLALLFIDLPSAALRRGPRGPDAAPARRPHHR